MAKQIKRILDIGSSDGYLLKMFKEKNPEVEVIGVEPNRGHMNWSIYVDNIPCVNSLDQVKGIFDLIIMYHQLEHVQQPEKQLKWVREHLSDDGLLYLALPTISRIDYPQIEVLFKDEHINIWTDETLTYFLNKNGFEEDFVDTALYGTCMILKKMDDYESLIDKTFYKENIELLKRIKICFDNKKQMESFMKSGRVENAKQAGQQALNAYDKFPELISKYASLFDIIDEQDILNTFIAKYPNLLTLHMQIAMSYFKERDFEKAKKHLNIMLESYGGIGGVLAHLAYIAYHEKDLLSAVKFIKESIVQEPFNLQNIDLLGNIVEKM